LFYHRTPRGPLIMKKHLLAAMVAVTISLPLAAHSVDAQRQAEVAKRGPDVMPFSLKDTTHVFTKSNHGGTQRVIAKDVSDPTQTLIVREHLREIQGQFLGADFSGPSHVHGNEMPGLSQLKAAQPGQLSIEYQDLPGGAELTYQTSNSNLVAALHRWFDAQLVDHGADAMEGHHHAGMQKK
jgi:hypothetical protein